MPIIYERVDVPHSFKMGDPLPKARKWHAVWEGQNKKVEERSNIFFHCSAISSESTHKFSFFEANEHEDLLRWRYFGKKQQFMDKLIRPIRGDLIVKLHVIPSDDGLRQLVCFNAAFSGDNMYRAICYFTADRVTVASMLDDFRPHAVRLNLVTWNQKIVAVQVGLKQLLWKPEGMRPHVPQWLEDIEPLESDSSGIDMLTDSEESSESTTLILGQQ